MNPVYQPTHPDSLLQADWLTLHEHMPPAKWGSLPSFSGAAIWLGMHHSLRKGQNELDYLNRQMLEQQLDWSDYQQRVLQAAWMHHGHLEGHHRYEDHSCFPRLLKLAPQLGKGFDLLEHDHELVGECVSLTRSLLNTVKHSTEPQLDLVERLHTAVQTQGTLLYRHLADEEDLVIPVLALHA